MHKKNFRKFPIFLDQIDISTQGLSKSTKNMLKHISVVFHESFEIIVGLRPDCFEPEIFRPLPQYDFLLPWGEQKSPRDIDSNYFNYD